MGSLRVLRIGILEDFQVRPQLLKLLVVLIGFLLVTVQEQIEINLLIKLES
jgi:hypothetical protein